MSERIIGECVVHRLGTGSALIERADPRIRIADELLDEIERGWGADWLSLNDDVLTLRGQNRTVVYRIDRDNYDPQTRSVLAEWPD